MINFTPLLSLFAKYRYNKLSTMDPVATQKQQLLKLIHTAKNTHFGQQHQFSKIHSVEDFQKQVRIRTYEDFWKEYWQPTYPLLDNLTWPKRMPYFTVTSGTTSGTTKYLPFTKEMMASNVKAGLDLLIYHVINNPKSKLFAGKSFVLGGSTDLVQEAPRVFSGDLSGIVAKTRPSWVAPFYFPSPKLALIKDWEEKIDLLARLSLKYDIRLLSGVPSWLLILINKLFEITSNTTGRLNTVYPNLEMIVHGGVNFKPYEKQFKDLIAGSNTELREVYTASEGFIATADRGYGEGLRLNLDNDIFYEFIPLEEINSTNPTRHWIGTIETGVNYAIVLTTCAGLWSYLIGDTVKFIDKLPPRLLITGRTSYSLSAFGEHLIGEEIEDAVSFAADAIGNTVTDYSVGAVFPAHSGELGGHRYIVEFGGKVPTTEDLTVFCKKLDQRLCERNEDYAAHRAEGFGLKDPTVTVAAVGTFSEWMKSRGKLGGQNKVPRIINDQKLFESLIKLTEEKLN